MTFFTEKFINGLGRDGLGRAGIGCGLAGIQSLSDSQHQAYPIIRDGRDKYRPKGKTIREKLQSEINEWLEPVRSTYDASEIS